MIGWPSLDEVLKLHARVVQLTGGSDGIRDKGGLESSLQQPLQAFASVDLYPTLIDKAAALGFFLISNHPFVDGNKRIGHACMELVLLRNGLEIAADRNDQESIILSVAAAELSREQFTAWLRRWVVPLKRQNGN